LASGFKEGNGTVGRIQPVETTTLVCGMLARQVELLDAAASVMEPVLGSIAFRSETIPFTFTEYYRDEMGASLLRQFVAFRGCFDPADLAATKRHTNRIEARFSVRSGQRRVNLDPGYVSAAKLVLATTKNYAHRVYLHSGIYGEVTLHYRGGRWKPFPWTYPDYRSGRYKAFFTRVRAALVEQRDAPT